MGQLLYGTKERQPSLPAWSVAARLRS
jgi:hypothetical protein